MNRIICSSKAIANMLERFLVNVPSWEQDEFFNIECKDKKLSIKNFSIDIECKSDWRCEFSFSRIKALKKLLKKVPEQPLVIDFGDSNAEIQTICI